MYRQSRVQLVVWVEKEKELRLGAKEDVDCEVVQAYQKTNNIRRTHILSCIFFHHHQWIFCEIYMECTNVLVTQAKKKETKTNGSPPPKTTPEVHMKYMKPNLPSETRRPDLNPAAK